MRSIPILALLAALASTPAEACVSGGTQYLFDEVPDNAPAGSAVMRVEFTNQGAAFDDWRARVPERAGERRLVGIARRIDGASGGSFPVYVLVRSCAHEFYGEPTRPWDRQAWLVGRFERLNGIEIFIARGRRWSVRPGAFEAD